MPETQKILYLVFSNAMAGKEDQFDQWYSEHIEQILAVEGFVSARRMKRADIEGRPTPEYAHLVAYEIAGDANAAFRKLRSAREAGMLSMPDPEVVDLPFKGVVYGQVD
jgi:hypothetical protein